MSTAALLLAAVAASGGAQAPPVFRAEVASVHVDVLVTREGKPVRGLRRDDFELRDSGRIQTLEPVLEERQKVDVGLVLDLSQSVTGTKLLTLRQAAHAFVDGLGPDEKAALITFQEVVRLAQPPTVDHTLVQHAIEAAQPRGSTALIDAVYAGLRLLEPRDRRAAVVVFSDGLDNVSWLETIEVVAAATRSPALVYAVAARDPEDPADPFLGEVTNATGGQLWSVRKLKDLRGRFLDVLEDIRSRYVLRYTPTGVDRGGWHKLDVRLKGGSGRIVARPGYWQVTAEP